MGRMSISIVGPHSQPSKFDCVDFRDVGSVIRQLRGALQSILLFPVFLLCPEHIDVAFDLTKFDLGICINKCHRLKTLDDFNNLSVVT